MLLRRGRPGKDRPHLQREGIGAHLVVPPKLEASAAESIIPFLGIRQPLHRTPKPLCQVRKSRLHTRGCNRYVGAALKPRGQIGTVIYIYTNDSRKR